MNQELLAERLRKVYDLPEASDDWILEHTKGQLTRATVELNMALSELGNRIVGVGKTRDQFHRDHHLPARRRTRRDELYFWSIVPVSIAMWAAAIVLLWLGWGAISG